MQPEFYFQAKKYKTNLKFSAYTLIFLSLISISIFGNAVFAENDDKIVIMYTNSGQLTIELFPEDAPNTVENFLKLTESGFYDDLIFHRIIKDFMIQGGDPLTKYEGGFANVPSWGTGDAGYTIPAEFNDIKHDRGIVSMARGADVNSASSQFFIVHKDSNHLDGKYTVFGKLLTEESYDTLDKIANLRTLSSNVPSDLTATQITNTVVLTRADIPHALKLVEELDRFTMDTGTVLTESADFERYINTGFDFSIIPPKGWSTFYAEPGSGPNDPIVTFLGPKKKLLAGIDEVAPYIYINVIGLDNLTFQQNLENRVAQYHKMEITGALVIESEKTFNLKTEKGRTYGAYSVIAKQVTGGGLPTPFAQILMSHGDFLYGITYANHEHHFQTDMKFFDEMILTFEQISEESEPNISGLLEETGD